MASISTNNAAISLANNAIQQTMKALLLLADGHERRLATEQDRIAYAILPKFGGTLSIISSTFLARDILINRHEKKSLSLKNAMLLGISINDIFGTFFSYFMTTWMVPRGEAPFAAGNQATCNAQGFFVTYHFIYFVTAYTQLCILFWLIVKKGWSDHVMKQCNIRLAFILPPAIIALVASILPFFFEMYNEARIHCMVMPYPTSCLLNTNIECTRGGDAAVWMQLIGFLYALVCNFIIVIFMALLVYAVYSQEKQGDRYVTASEDGGRRVSRTFTHKAAWQGVRYSSAFIVAYVWLYAFMGLNSPGLVKDEDPGDEFIGGPKHRKVFDTLFYFHCILTPLMGFFNALIYFRGKYTSFRGQHQDMSKMDCLCEVLKVKNRCRCRCGKKSDDNVCDEKEDGGDPKTALSPDQP